MHAFNFYRFISILLIVSPCISFAMDEIPLKMHIFPEEKSDLTLVNEAVTEPEPEIHMTIFTADEEQVSEQLSYKDNNDDDEFSFFYYLDSGYQNDSFNWSVASPTGTPDTLTEVEWKNLSLVGFDVGFTMSMPYNLVFKGDARYAWTVAGNSRQTSFLRDGRTRPFSSIENDSDDGYAWYGSFALGYALDFGSMIHDPVAFNFTPLAGYSWRKQNLKADNGREQLAGFILSNPETRNLENSYSARWDGPWLGADMTLSAFQHHQIFSSFQHHWADYKAEGHWRQSPELQQPKSFEHNTDATGIVASAGYRYLTDELWGVSVSIDYQNWESESGKETLFTINENQFNSRLNEVERESFGINIGVNMDF